MLQTSTGSRGRKTASKFMGKGKAVAVTREHSVGSEQVVEDVAVSEKAPLPKTQERRKKIIALPKSAESNAIYRQ